ncbi:MAG: hypothetical protein ABSG46_09440, partial [Candidatus Binataceae bacterium]
GVVLTMAALMKARSDGASMYSYRELANSVRPYLAPGCVVASYHHQIQSLPFYTGRREVLIGYRGELGPFGSDPDAAGSFITNDAQLGALWSSSECFILIANRIDLPHLYSLLKPAASIVGCEGKKFALLNHAAQSRERSTSCGPAVVDSASISDTVR